MTYLEAQAEAKDEARDDEYVVRVQREDRSWIAVYGQAGPIVDGLPTAIFRAPQANMLYAVPVALGGTATKQGLRRIVTRREQVGVL